MREETAKLRTKTQGREIEAPINETTQLDSYPLHKVSVTPSSCVRPYSQSSRNQTTRMLSTTQASITVVASLRMEITTNRPSKTKRSIRKRSTRSSSLDKSASVLVISFGDSATQSVRSSGTQTMRQTSYKLAHRIAQFSSKKKPTYSDQSSQTKASMREFITGRSLQMRGPKTRSRLE